MKRFSTYFVLLFLVNAISLAQNVHHVTLNFNAEDFNMDATDGKLHISSLKHTLVFDEDTLSPALPYACVYVLLGPNEQYSGVSTSMGNTLFYYDVELPPSPIPSPTNSKSFLQQLNSVFEKSKYPDESIVYTGTHNMGGISYASFLICPFQYEPSQKTLCLSTTISLSVGTTTKHDDNKNSISPGAYCKEMITYLVANPENMESLYPTSACQNNRSGSISSYPLQYLIVTCDSLKSEFQKLADWKITKGIVADIITLEDIYANYQSGNALMKIKYAIKNAFENSAGSLKYVLLGGSPPIVPTMSCRVKREVNDFITDENDTPTDIYFACLTDINWNKNNNAYCGEVSDSVDVTPDIIVTRLPASNRKDVQNLVARIIEYERYPDTRNWKNEILMCGVRMHDDVYFNGSTVSDAHAKSEIMYQNFHSYWSGSKYRFYDTGTDHASGTNYDVTRDHLQSELSKGYHFVNVITHGLVDRWSMENNTWNYSKDYAGVLQNPSYSIIATNACHTNAINHPDTSLGISFMQNPTGGVLSYYGAAIENWDVGDGYLYGGTQQLDWMYDELFRNTMGLGEAIFKAKLRSISACQTNSMERWLHFTLTPLCDPEMHVYTAQPTYLDKTILSNSHNDFSISVNPHDKVNVCVMSRLDMGESYYDFRQENDNLIFSNTPTECLVTVTSPNKIAYQAIHGGEIKLQNEVLENNLDVIASEIHIGSNVATEREPGPISVENGYSILSGGNGTTIYNDFEVKLGAELEIYTNN